MSALKGRSGTLCLLERLGADLLCVELLGVLHNVVHLLREGMRKEWGCVDGNVRFALALTATGGVCEGQ